MKRFYVEAHTDPNNRSNGATLQIEASGLVRIRLAKDGVTATSDFVLPMSDIDELRRVLEPAQPTEDLTLRDQFAMRALTGLISSENGDDRYDRAHIGRLAYAIADTMLAARAEGARLSREDGGG